MKFSIIIPVYNRENCIKNVIESVLNQYGDWELILIDDGSTDRTGYICKEFAGNNSRITYIFQENAGVCVARNAGIISSSGEYIVFLDSDNTLKNDAIKVLEKRIIDVGHADLVCYGYDASLAVTWIPEIREDIFFVNQEDIRKCYIPTHLNINSQEHYFLKNFIWNKTYNRKFLIDNNLFFDESRRTWEDGIFIINCLDAANDILLIDKSIYNAYCDQTVEHLSSKWFKDQLMQYILDEQNFKDRFGSEYNFNSTHYCRSNFVVLKLLLERSVKELGRKSIPFITEAINHPLIKHWIYYLEPSTYSEKKLLDNIQSGDGRKIYSYFSLRLRLSCLKGYAVPNCTFMT